MTAGAAGIADQSRSLRPSRRTTKRITIGLLVFCAAGLTYIVVRDSDSRLHETIAVGLMALIPSLYGAYVASGGWDFAATLKTLRGQ